MQVIPSFAQMDKWLTKHAVPSTDLVRLAYEDVIEVLGALLVGVPVDEAWYLAEYPVVRKFLSLTNGATAASHFQRHGYFEGRKPFSSGWEGRQEPFSFADFKAKLRPVLGRGRLAVEIERASFLDLIRQVLGSVSVDEAWYRLTYPASAEFIACGHFTCASSHFANVGYFEGYLPCAVSVDDR
jgi:hypothetical protein